MHDGDHLTCNGIQEILNIRASRNRGLSEDLRVAFPNTVPVRMPLYAIRMPLRLAIAIAYGVGLACMPYLIGRHNIFLTLQLTTIFNDKMKNLNKYNNNSKFHTSVVLDNQNLNIVDREKELVMSKDLGSLLVKLSRLLEQEQYNAGKEFLGFENINFVTSLSLQDDSLNNQGVRDIIASTQLIVAELTVAELIKGLINNVVQLEEIHIVFVTWYFNE